MILNNLISRFKKVKLSETPQLIAKMEAITGCRVRFVSKGEALTLSTIFACIRLLSETVGTLPCPLYERTAEGGKVAARAHPLYTILHDSPNADLTSVEYWERVVADLCGWGNHYSEKIWNASRSQIVALIPLKPDLVNVGRDEFGQPLYVYADPYSSYREIAQDDIFHVRGFGTTESDLVGLSPLAYAQRSLSIAVSTDQIADNTFKGGMRPSGVLKTERVLNDKQRKDLENLLKEMAGGPEQAGGLIVLEGGYEYSQISINPNDAQLLENRSFNVEDLCRWFRVPPFMVGHTQKSTSWGTGLEQQNIAFATYTLRPYLSRIEKAISKWLLSPAERGKYVAEFNMEGLLRADSGARTTFYSAALQNGWMNRNEVREKENLAPVTGGEKYTVQTNLVDLNNLGSAEPTGRSADVEAGA